MSRAKVLKKMIEEQMKNNPAANSDGTSSYADFQKPNHNNSGFHAKSNSQIGAARQRSIGNRNTKPSNKV